MCTPSRFISVEVAIKTDADCDAFVEWFRARDNPVEKLPGGSHRWHVYFAPLPSANADLTIRDICGGIPDWPDEVRAEWDAAAFRQFFVGYEIGTDPAAFTDHFEPATLALAAGFGAGIGLAIYPPAMRPPASLPEREKGKPGEPAG